MRKLADISAFESLASSPVSSISVFNRLNWKHPIDKAIMRLDWQEFERLARGQDRIVDKILDAVKDLGLTRDFMFCVHRDDDNDRSDECWWEQFKNGDKKRYWSWLRYEQRRQEKEFGKLEDVSESEYDKTAEEAYREAKRMSQMETGRFDEGYDAEPLDEYYNKDSSDRYLN